MTVPPVLVGRQSSHYTRAVRIFAHEVGVALELEPIYDLMSVAAPTFAGNPALKLPILRRGADTVFGTLNICRTLYRDSGSGVRVAWPETATTPLLMNAHELLAHAMSVEVEVVVHEFVEKRPADNASRKRRQSLENCLAWLDAHLDAILGGEAAYDLRWFEIGLFCLLEHFPFRNPVDLSALLRLVAFAREFGERESARITPYRFDK